MTTAQEVAIVVQVALRKEAEMNDEPVWQATRERVRELIAETVSARRIETGNWRRFVNATVKHIEEGLDVRPGLWRGR